MIWLSLKKIAEMTGGRLYGADADIDSVSIDSRNISNDQLFIAIKGERFDAHDFVADLEGRAVAALVHKKIDCDVPQILVKDTLIALGEFAAAWRKTLSLPVIALTGSNGKTTVKEMLASILSQQGNVLATLGNFNNEIGLPLTLLRLRAEHDYAVIEMGANHFGEIAYLTQITQPNIALLNNAGAAHLEGFGDIKGVSRAKGEIFAGLDESGIAIINADDPYTNYWQDVCKDKKVASFGMHSNADIQGEINAQGQLLINPNKKGLTVMLKLLGDHNAMNALAATAAAVVVGAKMSSLQKGLEALEPVKGRLAPMTNEQGAYLIDDTYNANPSSLQMGINVLAKRQGTKILVLGDMGELGSDVAKLHYDIGKQVKYAGIDQLYCLGQYSQQACQAFGEGGHHFTEMDDLLTHLKPFIQKDTSVLIKGSRTMKMERAVNAFSTRSVI
jgi:UDP-N-acetylmuramoyl-tripeptide--D-alanyl-D-alanine ligase